MIENLSRGVLWLVGDDRQDHPFGGKRFEGFASMRHERRASDATA